jgi:DNA-binding response OmpR family regulator
MILESVVASLGFEAVTATNVAEAKALLTRVVPQIAVLDVMFPDGDGTDILLEIHRAGLQTIVAFISATLAEFPFHKCEACRPAMIFSKPLNTRALQTWLQEQAARLEPAHA